MFAALDIVGVNGKIHRRKHKVLWSFYFAFFRTIRNSNFIFKVVSRSLLWTASVSISTISQVPSPDIVTLFFLRTVSARSSSILCSILFVFALFPPLNERHEMILSENICMATLESDTIQAVKLLRSSFSSPFPSADFCLHKTVPSTLIHVHSFLTQTSKNSLFIVLTGLDLANILQYFQFWCIVHDAMWTNNWISMNLCRPDIEHCWWHGHCRWHY